MNNDEEMNYILLTTNDTFKDLNIEFKIRRISTNIYFLIYESKPDTYTDTDTDTDTYTDTYTNTSKCIICFHVYLTLNDRHIYLDALEKCQRGVSGTKILRKIIDLGRIINVKYIGLEDSSFFTIDNKSYLIAPLEILTTGKSWYNRFGFESSEIKDEIIQNDSVSKMSFKNVLDDLILEGKNIYEEFSENFPDIINRDEDKTIKDVLIELKKRYLNKNATEKLTEEQKDLVDNLLVYLDTIIYYNRDLILKFNYNSVGGYMKKNKRRQKTTRKRNQKTTRKRNQKTTRKRN
jgi:hypothetical protein